MFPHTFKENEPKVSQEQPEIVWRPSDEDRPNVGQQQFMDWLHKNRGLDLGGDPDKLWEWSVTDLEDFWAAVWDYFDIISDTPYRRVLDRREMPGAKWFEGSRVNWAEHVLRGATDARPAMVVVDESGRVSEVPWASLVRDVGALAATLRAAGVTPGDRVCAYVSNTPEAVVALLAATSIGAIWSACAPDFGLAGVADRFMQLEPSVLIATDAYTYGGKVHARHAEIDQLRSLLPTVRLTIVIPKGSNPIQSGPNQISWSAAVAEPAPLDFERVPFDHPLWVLFSSGTTGLPKGILHSHVGILVEQYKATALNLDLRPGDRWYVYSSTSWMVWNSVVGTLLNGVTMVVYDGSPGYPDVTQNWLIAAATQATVLGCGSAYLAACEKAGVSLEKLDLSALRVLIATGSVLPASTWDWVYEQLHPQVRLDSSSGGTDVCSGFVGGNPLKPVTKGELTGPYLGVKLEAWDADGHVVVDEVGELVITEPMPSMPLGFWHDDDGARFHDSYFDVYPGKWRHGDWIKTTSRGTVTIEGRSDSTLNKAGVRMGSSDIYNIVEGLSGIADSLVVGIDYPGSDYYMPLFVVCNQGRSLDDGLRDAIVDAIRAGLSPRHVPDEIVEAPAVPRTRTGKKLEVPIKNILAGRPVDRSVNLASVDDASAVEWFARFASERGRSASGDEDQ